MSFKDIKKGFKKSENRNIKRLPLISFKEIGASLNITPNALKRIIGFSKESFPTPMLRCSNTQIGYGNFYYDSEEIKKWLETNNLIPKKSLKGNKMKVTFMDSSLQVNYSSEEEIILDIEVLPVIGETIHISTSLLKGFYLQILDDCIDPDNNKLTAKDFIVVNKHAGNKYNTVAAIVDSISHIYKETGNIIEIKISFIECDDFDKENHDDDN